MNKEGKAFHIEDIHFTIPLSHSSSETNHPRLQSRTTSTNLYFFSNNKMKVPALVLFKEQPLVELLQLQSVRTHKFHIKNQSKMQIFHLQHATLSKT